MSEPAAFMRLASQAKNSCGEVIPVKATFGSIVGFSQGVEHVRSNAARSATLIADFLRITAA
jgi:hypothetical protein